MTRLSNIARVTHRSVHEADSVQEKAWMLYMRVRSLCHEKGFPQQAADGTPGFKYTGSLKAQLLALWPEVAHFSPEKYNEFERPIYAYLRATKNCVNLVPTPPVWWIADSFQQSHAGDTTGFIDLRAERESKLTPHEAGEDRSVAPVEIRYVLKETEMSTKQQILAELKKQKEPLSPVEIAVLIGDAKAPNSAREEKLPKAGHRTTDALKALLEEGKVYSRYESFDERRIRAGMSATEVPNGRTSRLFSLENPVPPRVTRHLIEGYSLDIQPLPTDAGAKVGAQKRSARNDRVLSLLIETGKPLTTRRISSLTGLSQNVVNDAVKDLAEAGLIHAGPNAREGRPWLVVDIPFEAEQPTPIPEPEPAPVSTTTVWIDYDNLSALERVVLKTLKYSGHVVTAAEISEVTGYSSSAISEVFRKFPQYVDKVGTRNRHQLYSIKGLVPTETPAPTQQLAVDASSLLQQIIADAVTQATASIIAENEELKAKLDNLRRALS